MSLFEIRDRFTIRILINIHTRTQGDSRTELQKNQGDRWLLVNVRVDSCWVLEKLGIKFFLLSVKNLILVKICSSKVIHTAL